MSARLERVNEDLEPGRVTSQFEQSHDADDAEELQDVVLLQQQQQQQQQYHHQHSSNITLTFPNLHKLYSVMKWPRPRAVWLRGLTVHLENSA